MTTSRENSIFDFFSGKHHHFDDLYASIRSQEVPVGGVGFVYRYSFYREELAQDTSVLPQTHVAFLAGEKEFFFQNMSDIPASLEEVLVTQYGTIHDYERSFLDARVDLKQILAPGEKYHYQDYLIQEHFKVVREESLLELFLRKHRNNRITPLLRPVSFSSLSEDLEKSVKGARRPF